MKLTSGAFSDGENIPRVYTCQGKNINPPLAISNVPTEAKSLVLLMDDPDVPEYIRASRMYDHWVVFNIDPKTSMIEENKGPFATMGQNTGGTNEYQGPCPPDREHRYFFKLYALDVLLDLSDGSTKAQVEKAMKGHILDQTTLMGRYVKS
ncbi:MAG: YbhB/YbcL family Raf kinase inhibitor-like protein [Chlamydiia bacterium]|nr:YbhB/YbcL family Raf kinase inhibitor-like protein [Chlamydiia bacterium]